MRTNLPKEMDFVHEADNAARADADFKNVRTSLYIPKVIVATRRVLIMEYIQGARVDNLEYLADWNIDRNKVAIELSRIFSRMVFINGWFHAVCPIAMFFLSFLSLTVCRIRMQVVFSRLTSFQ
jgi:aarF domain-containing kinase